MIRIYDKPLSNDGSTVGDWLLAMAEMETEENELVGTSLIGMVVSQERKGSEETIAGKDADKKVSNGPVDYLEKAGAVTA